MTGESLSHHEVEPRSVDREIVLLGASDPEHVARLLRRLPASGRLSVVEPDPALLAAALAASEVSDQILEGRLRVYAQKEPDAVAQGWEWPTGARALRPLLFLDGAGSEPSRHRFFEEVRERIDSRERDAAWDTGSLAALGAMAAANALANAPRLASTVPLPPLLSALAGRPGIIVAAGPSLDKNGSQLRDVGDRALLIAVDTAVLPLARWGVRPHLVLAVDPRERNVKNLAGADLGATRLLCEVATHPDLLGLPSAGTVLWAAENVVGKALVGLGLPLPSLAAFGSVATAALDLACRMDLDPVVLVGQDLAYSGEQPYCSGTAPGGSPPAPESEETWDLDSDGRKVRTTFRLQAFRDWMENRIAAEGGKRLFVNATEGGILKGGVVALRLREALSGLSGRGVERALATALGGPEGVAGGPAVRRALARLRDEAAAAAADLAAGRPLAVLLGEINAKPSLVSLVETIEASSLLSLRGRWAQLAPTDREASLRGTLARGCQRLLEMLERPLSDLSRDA